MQVKIYITKRELTHIIQQAMLIQDIDNETAIEVTIDDRRIAVDVPSVVRSTQRAVGLNEEHYNLDVPGKD